MALSSLMNLKKIGLFVKSSPAVFFSNSSSFLTRFDVPDEAKQEEPAPSTPSASSSSSDKPSLSNKTLTVRTSSKTPRGFSPKRNTPPSNDSSASVPIDPSVPIRTFDDIPPSSPKNNYRKPQQKFADANRSSRPNSSPNASPNTSPNSTSKRPFSPRSKPESSLSLSSSSSPRSQSSPRSSSSPRLHLFEKSNPIEGPQASFHAELFRLAKGDAPYAATSAHGVIAHMKRVGVPTTLDTYNLALQIMAHNPRDLPKAASLFRQMADDSIHPDHSTLATLVRACANANAWDLTTHFFREFSRLRTQIYPSSKTLAVAMSTACAVGKQNEGLRLLLQAEQRKADIPSSTYTSLLKSSVEVGFLDGISHCFHALKSKYNQKLDKDLALNALASAARKGDLVLCKTLRSHLIDDIRVPANNTSLWHSFFIGAAEAGDVPEALKSLNHMAANSIPLPHRSVLQVLVDAIAAAPIHVLDSAVNSLAEQKAQAIDSDGQEAPLHITSVSCLMLAAGQLRDITRSYHIFSLMKDLGLKPDRFALTCLMECCMNSRQLMAALRVFDEIRIAGETPDADSFHIAITGCISCASFPRAIDYWQRASAQGVLLHTETYGALIRKAARLHRFDLAHQVLQEYKDKVPAEEQRAKNQPWHFTSYISHYETLYRQGTTTHDVAPSPPPQNKYQKAALKNSATFSPPDSDKMEEFIPA